MMFTSSAALRSTGTYGYMAPEQFRGAAQPASDLYALGGTLLYLLSGIYFLCIHAAVIAHNYKRTPSKIGF